jgi:chromate transporter
MIFYIKSFLIFTRIGAFTIGGGYAMVPLIENELVDKRKWISREDFLDLMALAQTVPGIFAVNIAIFIGYKLKKFWKSLMKGLKNLLMQDGMWL